MADSCATAVVVRRSTALGRCRKLRAWAARSASPETRPVRKGGVVRRLSVFVAILGLSIGTAAAQEVNARAALQASLKAMGGENLKTIEYSGAGWSSLIGQTYGLDEDWPHFEVSAYTRAIDYEAKWSRE